MMQTANHRYWLRMLTRKPLHRIPLRQCVRNWWTVHGKTVKQRSVTMLLSWAFVAFWVGALMLSEWVGR